MNSSIRRFGYSSGLLAAAILLAILGGLSAALEAQEPFHQAADVATLEAQFQAMFTAALEMSSDEPPSDEPLSIVQAWGTVIQSAIMLERARRVAEGRDPNGSQGEEAADRVLARWQELRPEASGPDLFRTFRLRDPDARQAATAELLDRYPDDFLVLSHASWILRQGKERERVTAALEGFLARHPERPAAYRLLSEHFSALGNATREGEILEAWALATPEDPNLVSRWLASPLARQDPQTTASMIQRFLAGNPAGEGAWQVCSAMASDPGGDLRGEAKACLTRLTVASASSESLTDRATAKLAELAAVDGDVSALLSALKNVAPEARPRATLAAVRRLKSPAQCTQRLELLRTIWPHLSSDDSLHSLAASALRPCQDRPAAQALFLDLLRTVQAQRASSVVSGWATHLNGSWRGELPGGAAGVLEQRLEDEGDSEDLFRALDIVVQLTGASDVRGALLERWWQRFPDSLRGEEAIALALDLSLRGRQAVAIEVLRHQVQRSLKPEVSDLLWQLQLEHEGPEGATALAQELIQSGNVGLVSQGHRLAARSALLAEDFLGAERHYQQALEGPSPSRATALELLATAAARGEATRLPALAAWVCEETVLGEQVRAREGDCIAGLLAEAGVGEEEAVTVALREQIRHQANRDPVDVQALQALASQANAAALPDLAEEAYREILRVDPRDENSWTQLAVHFEKQGNLEDLETLLERVREVFPAPPWSFLRAVGRARTAARQPVAAIEILREALASLPAGAQTGWIDRDLRQAYDLMGYQFSTAEWTAMPAPSAPKVGATEQSSAPRLEARPRDLLAQAEALQSGSGGRFDPTAALALFEQAAVAEDSLARYRLGLLVHLGKAQAPSEGMDATSLLRGSGPAVESLAQQGDPYAQYLLGTAALVGFGRPVEMAEARHWLELAAQQGESWAWHNLGWMQETGRGYDSADQEGAIEAYRQASLLGNATSMQNFARLTLTPYASPEVCREASTFLRRGAEAGEPRAAALFGKALLYGLGTCFPAAPGEARPWLEAASAQDQPGAGYDLGLSLLLANEGKTDPPRAVALIEAYAATPDRLALETLAFLQATGFGTPRDVEKARQTQAEAARVGSDGFVNLAREAEQFAPVRQLFDAGVERLERLSGDGDSAASALLSRLFFDGQGVELDQDRALRLARSAQQEPTAMRTLGHAYRHGQGVDKDIVEAQSWLRRCANAGDSFCMMFYSQTLMDGKAADPAIEAGLRWLIRSAEAGNWWATGDLGRLYDEGWHGIPRDRDQAARWKRRRAALGDTEAQGWLTYNGYSPR